MKNYDLTPFWKSTIGFDQLFNLMQNDARRFAGEPNYPPYNIERTGEDTYTVALALAGFDPDEISITVQQNVLTVEGEKQEKSQHLSVSGNFLAVIPARVQPGRPCRGEGRQMGQWAVADRIGTRDSARDEASSHRD